MNIIIFCPHCKADKGNKPFSGLCADCGKFPASWHKPEDYRFEYVFGRKPDFEIYSIIADMFSAKSPQTA